MIIVEIFGCSIFMDACKYKCGHNNIIIVIHWFSFHRQSIEHSQKPQKVDPNFLQYMYSRLDDNTKYVVALLAQLS